MISQPGRAGVWFVLMAMVAGLAGCGSSGSHNGAAPLVITTAQWQMTASSSGTYGRVPVGLFLEVSGNAITGVAIPQIAVPLNCGPCCGLPFGSIAESISGSYDSAGNITLATQPAQDGTVLKITATTTTGTSFTGGNYTIAGGCFTDQGSVDGNEIPPLNGTYAGTVKSVNTGASYQVSATLGQTSTLNSRNFLEVTGSVSFPGYPCFTSATIDTGVLNNGLIGGIFQAALDTPNPAGAGSSVEGALSEDGKSLAFTYIAGGPGTGCTLDLGQGTLALQ